MKGFLDEYGGTVVGVITVSIIFYFVMWGMRDGGFIQILMQCFSQKTYG